MHCKEAPSGLLNEAKMTSSSFPRGPIIVSLRITRHGRGSASYLSVCLKRLQKYWVIGNIGGLGNSGGLGNIEGLGNIGGLDHITWFHLGEQKFLLQT